MNITERVLQHPAWEPIEFRGAEVDDFIESISDKWIWPTGEKLKDYLRGRKPTVIRGEPSPPTMLDETVRTGFGEVYGRDWYFETE